MKFYNEKYYTGNNYSKLFNIYIKKILKKVLKHILYIKHVSKKLKYKIFSFYMIIEKTTFFCKKLFLSDKKNILL